MHSIPPDVAANVPLILTEKTLWMLGVIGKMHLITVISLRHLPYLCTQDGYPQGFPQTTWHHTVHAVFVYIASFSSANQHSVSNQPISILNLIRPCPHRVHKSQYVPCSFHSDSNHQTDNSHTPSPASSMSINSSTCCINVHPRTHFYCMFHQLYSTPVHPPSFAR